MSVDPSIRSRPSYTGVAVIAGLALLLAAELAGIGIVYKHRIDFYCIDNWPPAACRAASRTLVSMYCVLGALALTAMLRPAPFRTLSAGARFRPLPLALNAIGIALAFVPLRYLVAGEAMDKVLPAFAFWTLGMGFILAGLMLCVAPLSGWRRFLRDAGGAILPAIGAGLVAPWLAVLIRPAWRSLDEISAVTFAAVTQLIGALGYDVATDPERRIIGTETFSVSVNPSCSGIEGLALVTLFVTLYLWLFRAELRFPRALLLYPVGLAASALFNVVRITALLVIGFEGNPELAVGGFHSHAGWLMFTLVALGLIALAQTLPGLKVPAATSGPVAPIRTVLPFWQDPVVARILPFATFMLGALLASAFLMQPALAYPARAVALIAVMAPFWPLYRSLGWRADPGAMGVGALVAAMWILIPVPAAEAPPYGALSGGLLALWILARGIGTTLLIPVIEELFFRDYLESRIRRGSGPLWAIVAALVSAGLFAALHDRWAEAFVAGLAFSWLARRSGGRIADAILAHGLANGLIFAAALATGRFEII
ncbi:exosortase E/protease, VPEID-CTERM system [Roseivivax halodurans]|uniref:exosortase E/protease, VPEID-CTERM system n=1 Tax=Roseivivax halodurans TaxID=93683 RepID=UPI003CC75F31